MQNKRNKAMELDPLLKKLTKTTVCKMLNTLLLTIVCDYSCYGHD